jgi:5'-nucleotidase
MNILVTNDDGIHAPGIRALVQVLSRNHTVVIVAPQAQRSAASQSFTFGHSYTVQELDPTHYQCSGLPVDCVMFALEELGPFDLVLSGINHGANIGWDIWYSGTVGAALEAARRKVPAMALSLDVLPDSPTEGGALPYKSAAQQVSHYLDWSVIEVIYPGTVLNVNFPGSETLIARIPAVARPGDYPFNRQILVRQPRFPDTREWLVHVEHRPHHVDHTLDAPESDGSLLREGPTMTLLQAPWPVYRESAQKPLAQWLAHL